MKDRLEKLLSEAKAELAKAEAPEVILRAKAKYLGKNGEIAAFLRGLNALAEDERRKAGDLINRVKASVEDAVETRLAELQHKKKRQSLETGRQDVTLPGRRVNSGALHPVTTVMNEVADIFYGLGFDKAEGPEIETDYYNFEALNIPKDHPAREMQDTFYISDDVVLRTHTSPVQIRVMQSESPPLRVIAPGAVYRRDSDVTHTPMFHQVEGFMVDRGVTFANLKATLSLFLHELFGKDTAIRFRPSFFPFTEPSAEADIRCVLCKGVGCRVCKGSGWLEILGAGMIHPNVFKAVGYDPERLSGFAFGLGIERIAMLKYGIDDLRLFFENDLGFLRQF